MPDTKTTWRKSGEIFPAAHLPSPQPGKGATFSGRCSRSQQGSVPTGRQKAAVTGTEQNASASAAPQCASRLGRACAVGFQATRAIGSLGTYSDTCVPIHAGPNKRTHLANVCRTHKTPSPWPRNCQENTSKSCFLTASHLYFSFVPLS